MSWIENDDLLGVEYFSRSNSKLPFNNEEEAFSLFNLEKENRVSTDDFQINYEDFVLEKREKSMSLINCPSPSVHSIALNNDEEKSVDNIFLKRTYFDAEDLISIKKQLEHNFVQANWNNLKERMKMKKQRTKFLLTKTRRDSGNFSDKVSSEGKGSTKHASNNSTGKLKFRKETDWEPNENLVNEAAIKKVMKMQKNREAAQKSRMYKKMEIENFKNRENLLLDENHLLRRELEKLKNTSKQVCENCRKLFEEKSSINGKNLERSNDAQSSGIKNKFRVIQNTPLTNSTLASISTSKYTIFTGILVIVCLIGNLFWGQIDYSTNHQPGKLNNRILITSFNDTHIEGNKLPLVPNIDNLKIFPPVVIDDQVQNKSLYVKFVDYIKWKTGYTQTSPIDQDTLHNENINNKSNLKKNFLEKESKINSDKASTFHDVIYSKNVDETESCKNNNTFSSFDMRNGEFQLKHNDNTTKILKENKVEEKESNICTTTKFKGYFDLEFTSHKDSCKLCSNNITDNQNTLSQNFLDSSKTPHKFDPLYFKILIPVENGAQEEKENLSNFIVDLMHHNNNFNESLIMEKNSKLFYYAIECVIYDVNKLSKDS